MTGTAARPGVLAVAGIARLDTTRRARTGIPEVVLARPKPVDDLVAVVDALLLRTPAEPVPVSRLRGRQRAALLALAERRGATVRSYGRRGLALLPPGTELPAAVAGPVGLLAAGTSDLEVLEEVRLVLDCAGVASQGAVDVGVAAIHRLAEPLATMVDAGAVAFVVAAGMDGALPSVVSGLVGVPVVGVPTSTGYGVGGRGRAALLSILQGCAPGLVAVNVDNGVGAGAAVARIALGATRR